MHYMQANASSRRMLAGVYEFLSDGFRLAFFIPFDIP